jgi:hypothetical protein
LSEKSIFITPWFKKVIATSIHDSTQFYSLTQDEDKAIFADSGYMCRERSEEMPLGCKKQV